MGNPATLFTGWIRSVKFILDYENFNAIVIAHDSQILDRDTRIGCFWAKSVSFFVLFDNRSVQQTGKQPDGEHRLKAQEKEERRGKEKWKTKKKRIIVKNQSLSAMDVLHY
jgi:hypothetical protein